MTLRCQKYFPEELSATSNPKLPIGLTGDLDIYEEKEEQEKAVGRGGKTTMTMLMAELRQEGGR